MLIYHRNARSTLLVAATAVFLVALVACAVVLRPLRATELPADARALVFLDRDGAPLGTVLGRDDRHTVAEPLDRISPSFVRALIAAEDGRFVAHGALDPLASARATLGALARGEIPAGASTISMQLARTLRPMPAGLAGKIAESVLATRIENGMSKSAILEAYANRAPMGANLYGVEAAARTYFGIDAEQLDLAQSATLAALPNAPSRLDPYRHPGRLRARARTILGRMRALGFIDATAERVAAAEDLDLRPPDRDLVAPQFLFSEAARTPPGVDRVRTTIDAKLQRFVQTQLRAVVGALAASDVRQAAALVVDNRTAQVLAYAGSVAYDDADGGRNDGVRALRQPGSALKPFLYELAFERRTVRPYEILPDVPTAYAIPGARLYAPSDYSTRFLGPVRPRVALADSLNVPAVRVLERTGVGSFLERLHALGFTHLDRGPDYYGLGLTLGAGEVSLWELARAYLAMERDGRPTPLVTTLDAPPSRETAASETGAGALSETGAGTLSETGAGALSETGAGALSETGAGAPEWAEVRDILADPHARAASFGVDSILALPYAAAVKTGTSSDFRDTWTVGFSRDVTVAVWVGNFDGRPMRHVSGVTGAGPIWSRIMRHLHERSEPPPFDPPAGWQERAICTTQPRLWHPGCSRADEWLDAGDLRALAALARDDPNPRLGNEFDAWLASQSPDRRAAQGARILFPRPGDVFVDARGATQRIDVAIATRDPAGARLAIDGHELIKTGDAWVVTLAPGRHDLRLRAADGVAAASFLVVPRGPPTRTGFTIRRR